MAASRDSNRFSRMPDAHDYAELHSIAYFTICLLLVKDSRTHVAGAMHSLCSMAVVQCCSSEVR
jgi:hypothetical protein